MKNKNNILVMIEILIVFLGALLPAVRIAQENINFIKENGSLIIILVAAMFLLVKLNYKQLLYIPSIISIILIVKFIIDNKERLNQINALYNCYASYEYGIIVMILGNILILVTITIQLLNIKTIKEKTEKVKQQVSKKTNIIKTKTENVKTKLKEKKLKEKLLSIITKLKRNKNITHETTKDGKISFNKITVKCDNKIKYKEKKTLKQRIALIKEKFKLKRVKRKKLSISTYKEEKNLVTYNVPVIDIKKWTRSSICCSNCGATVHTTSEYCFLCDCKIKLNQEEKLS